MTQLNPQPPVAISGLLLVDKPLGWSSMTVVRHVRRAATAVATSQTPETSKRKWVKTGHAGTLDPLATGLVICCLGKATQRVPVLMGLTKVYEAQVDLSAFTTTDDREGEPTPVAVASPPDYAAISAAMDRFIGLIEQVPPNFSAVHVAGRRAYKMARKGEPFVIAPKTVRIDAIELLDYAWPLASLRITCGKGTYIRSLARDLGKVLGTGGHLAALCGTKVGPYDVANAVTAERLTRPITQGDLLAVP